MISMFTLHYCLGWRYWKEAPWDLQNVCKCHVNSPPRTMIQISFWYCEAFLAICYGLAWVNSLIPSLIRIYMYIDFTRAFCNKAHPLLSTQYQQRENSLMIWCFNLSLYHHIFVCWIQVSVIWVYMRLELSPGLLEIPIMPISWLGLHYSVKNAASWLVSIGAIENTIL